MMSYDGKAVYLACGFTDMRKGVNGLSSIVEASFKLDPFSGAMFVFCNRGRDRLKILEWDGDGFWLHVKRLEKGHFRWTANDGETVMRFTCEELKTMLNGTKVEAKLRRNEVTERRAI